MIRSKVHPAVSGITGVALALALSHCNFAESESASSVGDQGQRAEALALSTSASLPFQWSFTEQYAGTSKPALAHNINGGYDYDQLYLVRRIGGRLESFFLAAEGILQGPSSPFGPTNAIGDPTMAANGADGQNLYVAIKNSAGKIILWRVTGTQAQVSAFGSGLASSHYGSPSMAYNAISGRLEIVYREGFGIRHWNGTRQSNGSYTWVNALIPAAGGNGSKVVSAVSLAQGTDGRLTVVARRSEGDLKFWHTSGSSWPYTWSAGPAFGYSDASTEWPALVANGDGSLQVLARGAQIPGTPELMQFEIRNNTPSLLAIIAGSDYRQPVAAMLSTDNLWMSTVMGSGSILANGTR